MNVFTSRTKGTLQFHLPEIVGGFSGGRDGEQKERHHRHREFPVADETRDFVQHHSRLQATLINGLIYCTFTVIY